MALATERMERNAAVNCILLRFNESKFCLEVFFLRECSFEMVVE